jgi:mannose-6-phosphate isomerase-like protein (cupin superfamily)
MEKFNFTIAEATDELNNEQDKKFVTLLKHGSMSIEYFAPKHLDTQLPHMQDELYVIASGTSQFFRNGQVINCNKGDVIFVSAKMEHRFIDFTDDFATWVIFYGPEGGESSQ